MKHFHFVLLFAITISCSPLKKDDLSKYMLGKWETQYIKINMPTVHKSDSSSVFEDDFSKPTSGKAQSKYNNDGTFSAWFKLADGSEVDKTSGKWKTKGDSLFIDYSYNEKQVSTWYFIEKTKKGFNGTVIYDWDNDGEFDDTLYMKSKKIK